MEKSKNEIDGMEYLGEHFDYQLFRNSDGEIEGYKSIGLENSTSYCRVAKDLKRVVTHTKTIAEFIEHITAKNKLAKPKKKYNPHKDENQHKLDVL
jgi:hypothetical protein